MEDDLNVSTSEPGYLIETPTGNEIVVGPSFTAGKYVMQVWTPGGDLLHQEYITREGYMYLMVMAHAEVTA